MKIYARLTTACWGLSLLANELSALVVLRGELAQNLGNKSSVDANSLTADAGTLSDGADCSFELYDPRSDMLRTVDPTRLNLAFHQGAVYVVDGKPKEDGTYQRYLTFNQGTGTDGLAEGAAFNSFFAGAGVQQLVQPKCREQVQVTCKATEGQANGGCDTKLCKPNVRENSIPEYRVLLGSALSRREQLGRVAVLGFGAGIVPAVVAQSHPEAIVEAVDISGDVLAAAGCFGVEASDKMKLVQADGRSYVEDLDDHALDILFLDIYDDKANIPPCFTTAEFFALAKRKLTDGGTLAMNLVTHEMPNVLPAISASFSSMKLGQLPSDQGNRVLLASASSSAPSADLDSGADSNSFSSLFASWSQEGSFEEVKQISSAPRTDANFCA